MATKPPTIIDIKISFLRQQILLLSQPLSPSSAFLSKNTSDAENALRQKSIDDALHKLNGLLRKHNKLAYGPQATRHVAEQIDRLYWSRNESGVVVGEEWAERDADFRKEEIIEQLPEEWEGGAEEQAEKYKYLQQRLVDLSERRKAAGEKVERLKCLKALVEPFGEEGEVQKNIVTKNGEIEVELERMRRLLLRVERGVGGLEDREEEEVERMDVDDEEEGRVLALLGSS